MDVRRAREDCAGGGCVGWEDTPGWCGGHAFRGRCACWDLRSIAPAEDWGPSSRCELEWVGARGDLKLGSKGTLFVSSEMGSEQIFMGKRAVNQIGLHLV